MLTNCTFNIAEVSSAEEIFGSDKGNLRGNTARTKPQEFKSMHFNLPMELIAKYQLVVLSADYMFVNGILFFNTYSREIKFITSWKQEPKTDLPIQDMKSINAYYANKCFKIVELRADQQFEPARAALVNMDI